MEGENVFQALEAAEQLLLPLRVCEVRSREREGERQGGGGEEKKTEGKEIMKRNVRARGS